jgi:hypothetical protein
MKMFTLSLIIACNIILSASALAQQPPPNASGPANCYLEVKAVSSENDLRHIWETDWGSYERDHFDRVVLGIRVGTVGPAGGEVKAQIYFIGRKLDNNERYIYGREEKPLAIPPAYFTQCYVASPQLKSNTVHMAVVGEDISSTYHRATGSQRDGWIVCIIDDKYRVLASTASSESLHKMFFEPVFEEMLKQKPLRKSRGVKKHAR